MNDEDVIINFVEKIFDNNNELIEAKTVMAIALELYEKEFANNRAPLGLYYHIKVVSLLYSVINSINTDDKLDIQKYELYYVQKEVEKCLYRVLPFKTCDFYLNILAEKELDETGILIRDIILDANKIVSIDHNKIVKRIKEKYKLSNYEEKELFKHVNKFITDNMTHIVKNLCTKSGIKLCIQRRSELYIAHEDWRKKVFPIKN